MQIFVSYAHVDTPNVEQWLVQHLRVVHDVWFDTGLVGGQNWKQQLAAEVERCDALVYAMTPESVASQYCEWEVKEALRLKKIVVPILMQRNTQVPAYLSDIQYVDFSEGDTPQAVAKLLKALTVPTPPSVTSHPKPYTSKTMSNSSDSKTGNFIKIVGTIFGIIVGMAGILSALPESTRNSLYSAVGLVSSTSVPTAAPTFMPTPATPIVIAQRDLDIRSGPGASFPRLNILPINDSLDVLGISEDRLWYLVLLSDGTTGWVLTSESGVRLNGNRSVVRVVIPTATVTPLPTNTTAPTDTPRPTDTPSITPIPSETPQPSDTPQPTNTLEATATFTDAPTQTQAYPCEATVTNPDGSAMVINVVHVEASNSSARGSSVRVGTTLSIERRVTASDGDDWYLIYEAGQRLGWIPIRYIIPSDTCPS